MKQYGIIVVYGECIVIFGYLYVLNGVSYVVFVFFDFGFVIVVDYVNIIY